MAMAKSLNLLLNELTTVQGRNHGKILAATSAMVGRICPPWLEIELRYLKI